MAAKDNIGKASAAARAAQQNQYVRRLLEDEDLRESLLSAYRTARSAYGRMSNGKPVARSLLEDRKLQRELAEVLVTLQTVGDALKEPPRRRRRRGGFGRTLLLAVVAGVLALALSEGLRSKVLDLLFGAEEEFDYSSTTMPAQEAPSSVGAPAA
ncbi:MAG TPA: hypothetical protein VMU32_08450 [Solirubrobacteraceae bacterium]|nr:hypothetical protein [Solirubrobacteraceae bacterium]